MKTSLIGLLAAFGLSSVACYGILPIGEGKGTELFVTGAVGFQYDDNIFLRTSNPAGDYVTTLSPGIDLPFSSDSITKGDLAFNEALAYYSNHSSQDSHLGNAKLTTSYDDDKIKASFDASFAQLAQNSPTVVSYSTLIRSDTTSAAANAEMKFTEKSSASVGATFGRTTYGIASFTGQDVIAVPFFYFYEVTPKVDMSLRYEYRYTDLLKSNADNTDNSVAVGARGEFTPKLSGNFNIGAVQRNFRQGGRVNLLNFDSALTYTYSPKTLVQLGIARDFNSVATGSTVRTSSINLGVTSKFTESFSANIAASYMMTDYYSVNRSDKYWDGTAELKYQFNTHASLAAGYSHRMNSSSSPVGFSDNVFNVVASFRF